MDEPIERLRECIISWYQYTQSLKSVSSKAPLAITTSRLNEFSQTHNAHSSDLLGILDLNDPALLGALAELATNAQHLV